MTTFCTVQALHFFKPALCTDKKKPGGFTTKGGGSVLANFALDVILLVGLVTAGALALQGKIPLVKPVGYGLIAGGVAILLPYVAAVMLKHCGQT
ncbi:MAG: hypothetical protein S4CHLAM81_04990 [Chlamydiales bacterium]|nr:hypothetical protein [Chlamydiales bacterium]MCH9635287.1 hypothetical protein [Chlamydiales bacterium]MCH9704247.1 hypothetical protein [Chlamydiota bacterium]